MSQEPRRITSAEELGTALGAERFLLFKHSSMCPISTGAFREYQAFTHRHPDLPTGWLDVVLQRDLAVEVVERTGVAHQSPQAIWMVGGEVQWHASHGGITADSLAAATDDAR